MRPWILLTTFGLCCTAAEQWTDDSHTSKLKAVADIVWKTLTTEIEKKGNVMFFTVPIYTDIAFIYDVLDEKTKQSVRNLIGSFDVKESDLAITLDGQFRRFFSNEIRFKTIFYESFGSLSERKLIGSVKDRASLRNNRFNLISAHFDGRLHSLRDLLMAIEMDSIGETCEVRYCPVQAIIASKPPLAIITLATWSITSIEEFEWTAPVRFTFSDTQYTQVRAVQGLAEFEHATFTYSSGCTCRVLRVPYKSNFNLIFAIPDVSERCSSTSILWDNLQKVNFTTLKYVKEVMYVSIPLFKVSANIDLKLMLRGTALADAFDQPSSSLYNALAFQAAEVIFKPQVTEHLPKAFKLEDAAIFDVKRPFFFALIDAKSSTPLAAGLINKPDCTSRCRAERP